MAKSKLKSLPHFGSLDELVKFFDAHDMGEYWESLPEARMDINIKRRTHLFALDQDIAERLTIIAKAKHVPSEKLINSWLKEKLERA